MKIKKTPKEIFIIIWWSFIISISTKLFSLITSLILTRTLGQNIFGELGIIWAFINTMTSMSGIGLGIALIKNLSTLKVEDTLRIGRMLGLSFLIIYILGLICTALIIIFSSAISSEILNNDKLNIFIKLSSAVVFLNLIMGVQVGIQSGFGDFKGIARNTFLTALISMPSVTVGAYQWGLYGALIGMIISTAYSYFLNSLSIKKILSKLGVKKIYERCWEERDILIKFSIPASLSSFITAPVVWYANILLVQRPNGYNEMAIFTISQQWQSIVLFLPASVSTAIIYLLSQSSSKKEYKGYWGIVKINFILTLIVTSLVTLIITLLTPNILSIYGKGFIGGETSFILIIITAVLISLNNIFGQIIASTGKMWFGLVLNIIWAINFLFISIFLINKFGILGLAIAYLSSYTLHLFFSYFYLKFVHERCGE